MKYIYNIEKTKDYTEKIDFEEKIGKKAQNLLELAVQGFNVPKFSVVTNKYFREVILDEIKEYNRKEGNEDRDVFEFINDNTIAIEVLLKESKVRFHSKLNAYTGSKDDSFWDILFETKLGVLSRLLDVLDEKYSYLGSITFEFFTCGQFEGFDIDYGPCGFTLRWVN